MKLRNLKALIVAAKRLPQIAMRKSYWHLALRKANCATYVSSMKCHLSLNKVTISISYTTFYFE